MIYALLAVCLLGTAICVVGVLLHLRAVRRFTAAARAVERRVMPYLRRQAAELHVDVDPPDPLRTSETIIEQTCALAEALHEVAQKADDMALGPTQRTTKPELRDELARKMTRRGFEDRREEAPSGKATRPGYKERN